MGPAARSQGACPNNRLAAPAPIPGVAVEEVAEDEETAKKDKENRIAAAKAAGYQIQKNGTVAYTRVGKANGKSKEFSA